MNTPQTSVVAVVDDDERVLESLKDLLESAGYRACTFGSARAFLDSESLRVADCLVSDLRMPDVDGWQLAAAVERARPGLPVIFVTGQGGVAPPGTHGTTIPVFQKPFDGPALLAAIRAAVTGD